MTGFGDEDTDSNNKGVPLPPPPQEEEVMDDDEQKKQLDLNSSSRSYASYRSAMSSLSEAPHHPLAIPADSDPLLSPRQPQPPPPPYPDVEIPPPPPATTATTDASGNYSSSITEEPPHPLHFRSQSQFRNGDEDPKLTSSLSTLGDLRNGGGGRRSGSNNNGGIQSPNSVSWEEQSSSCSSQEYYMFITVSNPRKEQETSSSSSASSNNNSFVPGGNTHVSYLITTRTNIPELGGSLSSPLPPPSEFRTRRRFKDVVNLSQRLSESFRGFFIPPRPDKSVVESQVMYKQEFVEQRREALEKYLRRLAAHPAIRRSNELRAFLQVHGALPLPQSLMADETPSEVMQPAKGGGGGRDLLRIIKELKQSVANDWVGSRAPAAVEEDKVFLEKKEKLHHLQQQLSNTTQQAESLVKAQQDIGQTMGELGLAFVKLAKFENGIAMLNSQRIRAADMKAVATAAVKASRLYRELNTQTVEHTDTLHEYLGFMLAVHSAFSDRSSALLTVQTLDSELLSLHRRAEKLEAPSSNLFGGDKSRPRKIEELKETMRVTEDAKQCADRRYQHIKENNKSEIERFDRERGADFLNMLKGLATNQVNYAEKIADIWTKVAEETSGYAK